MKILVIDGHDGSGKTTIAKKISEKYGMKYVKPFSDSLGDLISWECKQKNFKFINDIALAAVEKILFENKGIDLVFDRHWLSMYTILPEEFHDLWTIPVTICCWADVSTTIFRLKERNNNEVNDWDHRIYCDLYKKYAEQYGAMILNTSENDNLEYNIKLVDQYLKTINF